MTKQETNGQHIEPDTLPGDPERARASDRLQGTALLLAAVLGNTINFEDVGSIFELAGVKNQRKLGRGIDTWIQAVHKRYGDVPVFGEDTELAAGMAILMGRGNLTELYGLLAQEYRTHMQGLDEEGE